MEKKNILTFIDLTIHLIIAFVLALFFRWLTGGWAWPVLAIIGGILIDLDHFIDYFLYFGPRFSLADFFGHKYIASGRIYVIFHSWEITAVLWLVSAKVLWVTPFVTGISAHLLVDCFFRPRPNILFYSLVYRSIHGFRKEEISPEDPAGDHTE